MACAEPTGTAAKTASASIALVAFIHFDFMLRPPLEDCPRPGSEQSPSHGETFAGARRVRQDPIRGSARAARRRGSATPGARGATPIWIRFSGPAGEAR